jgi:proton-translocating NADH-quinone oxidoreductase chain M
VGLAEWVFVTLTFLLRFVSIVVLKYQNIKNNNITSLIVFIVCVLCLVRFVTNNVLVFYICYECLVLPLIIRIWKSGKNVRKIKAGWYLFFFTMCFSIPFLVVLIDRYTSIGTFDFFVLKMNLYKLPIWKQYRYWVRTILAFCVKVPMVPFHIWLPEAHVESPTIGSMLLAGLVLKVGLFGIYKYNIVLNPVVSIQMSGYMRVWAIIGLIYAAILIFNQIDLKKRIAYASISHINGAILGLFSMSPEGVRGAIVLRFRHGVVSRRLFFIVGILYERYHSRLIDSYSGLRTVKPLMITCLFIRRLANSSRPLTGNFVGERLIRIGVVRIDMVAAIRIGIGSILTVSYSRWMFTRVRFGTLQIAKDSKEGTFTDLYRWERFVLRILLGSSVVVGLYPNCLVNIISIEIILYNG